MNLVRCNICKRVMIDEEAKMHGCPLPKPDPKVIDDILNALARKYIGLVEFKPSPDLKRSHFSPDNDNSTRPTDHSYLHPDKTILTAAPPK